MLAVYILKNINLMEVHPKLKVCMFAAPAWVNCYGSVVNTAFESSVSILGSYIVIQGREITRNQEESSHIKGDITFTEAPDSAVAKLSTNSCDTQSLKAMATHDSDMHLPVEFNDADCCMSSWAHPWWLRSCAGNIRRMYSFLKVPWSPSVHAINAHQSDIAEPVSSTPVAGGLSNECWVTTTLT